MTVRSGRIWMSILRVCRRLSAAPARSPAPRVTAHVNATAARMMERRPRKSSPRVCSASAPDQQPPRGGTGRRGTLVTAIENCKAGSGPPCARFRIPEPDRFADSEPRHSHLDLLVLRHALHGGPLHHAVLEGGVVLELAHRQLAAHPPGVEDER